MTSIVFAVVFQASVIATASDSYADAHRAVTETGKPMVILVGAQWCGACKQMRNEVMPQVRRRGLLRRVAYAFVDLDREQALGRELTEEDHGLIPQVIMYRKTKTGWLRRRLVGAQDVETVESFISQGLTLDEAAKQGEKEHASHTSHPADDNPNS